jgi:hypothetical protein
MNPLIEYQQPPGAYAFHATNEENVDAIREDGIKHAIDTTSTTSSVEGALRKLGDDSPSPFDRTAITYCGVDAKFIFSYRCYRRRRSGSYSPDVSR